MKKKNKLIIMILTLLVLFIISRLDPDFLKEEPAAPVSKQADHTIHFPAERFPETAKHIEEAIAAGKSAVCTIDREGAEDNRKASLRGIATKKGYDRDEWPMAMCAEGGENADIAYISPSDNRGAGAWVSNQLEDYLDGTRVMFIME
ncbi:NucA/NucB deoxyribonuclease domain-containing protein [Paenibacillus nasutitermitis]|uniref:NucA/NucB deoxyribonuclease domain-containing protein n=1 Tax=Paenibacillus nasutitermitis TaxID=1652958 RepID=UPI001E58EA8D